jgi:hypothetical protein
MLVCDAASLFIYGVCADSRCIVMSTSRSLIVDILPIEKQQAGAAWGKHANNA